MHSFPGVPSEELSFLPTQQSAAESAVRRAPVQLGFDKQMAPLTPVRENCYLSIFFIPDTLPEDAVWILYLCLHRSSAHTHLPAVAQ